MRYATTERRRLSDWRRVSFHRGKEAIINLLEGTSICLSLDACQKGATEETRELNPPATQLQGTFRLASVKQKRARKRRGPVADADLAPLGSPSAQTAPPQPCAARKCRSPLETFSGIAGMFALVFQDPEKVSLWLIFHSQPRAKSRRTRFLRALRRPRFTCKWPLEAAARFPISTCPQSNHKASGWRTKALLTLLMPGRPALTQTALEPPQSCVTSNYLAQTGCNII